MASTEGSISGDRHDTEKNTGFEVLPTDFYFGFRSELSKSRKPSPVWDLFPVELQPGMLSMLAGKPNPVTFPFEYITLGVRSPNRDSDSTVTELTLRDDELAAGLQYNMTAGLPDLNLWLRKLMEKVHNRSEADEGWRVSTGPGSQDLLYKAALALLNPGDTILIEAPSYPGAVPIFEAINCRIIGVPTDSDGIRASDLASILENWDSKIPLPKCLYTIPFGSNPSGTTASQERRIEVLRIARRHNFLILEDDPYYFLYYGSMPRPTSYFSLEKALGTEVGRVLRFDSFSKIMAAGFRLGWVTGPKPIIDAMDLHSTTSTVQASSISQVIIHKLISLWGVEGFLAHTDQVAAFYRRKRDHFEKCLHRHLEGLAEWVQPSASMFYWLKLSLPPTPNGEENDASHFIRNKAVGHGVLVLPGDGAYSDGRRTTNVRVSFSLLGEEEIEEAVRRLAFAVQQEWNEYNKRTANADNA